MRSFMPANQNPFGLWSNPLLAAALAAAWVMLALAFNARPQWDLAGAAAFFDAERCAATAGQLSCRGFAAQESALLVGFRTIMHDAPIVIGVVLLVLVGLGWRKGMRWRDAGLRVRLVPVLALIIGPGLIVNAALKQIWGRPRPWMTEQFGGWMPFVEAGVIEGMCERNCSFVSGEAAGAGWLLCLTVLVPPRWRWPAFIALALISGAMAFLRVAFGAHYLSDVVLGYLLSVAVFVTVAALAQRSVARAR